MSEQLDNLLKSLKDVAEDLSAQAKATRSEFIFLRDIVKLVKNAGRLARCIDVLYEDWLDQIEPRKLSES